LEGRRPTPANDLWALGATLYHAVEGRPPFEAEGLHALAVAVFTRPYRTPVHAGPLTPVLEALLTKDPEQRVGAAEAAAMLASVLRSVPAADDPASGQRPASQSGRDCVPDAETEQASPPAHSAPPGPVTPHTPTAVDSGASPAGPRHPVPDRPTQAPSVPAPVPVPPAEDVVSPATTAKAVPDARRPARGLTRRSVVLGAALATLAAGSALTWTLSQDDGKPRGGGAAGHGAAGSAVTVVIGVDAPLTGDMSAMGLGIRNSAELAARTANEEGHVPGVNFEVRALDDASDPAKGAPNAAEFVSDAKVLGVVGPLNSGVAGTLVGPLAEADLVAISPGNTAPALTLGPDWAAGTRSRPYDTYFRTVTTDVDQGPFAARYLHAEAEKNKLYVIDDKSSYGAGLASGFTAEFEELGGTVVGTDHVDPGQRTFPGLAAKVRASGADAVFFGGYYDTAGPLSRQLKQAGVGIPLMGGDGVFDQAFLTYGPKADGDLALNIGAPAEHLDGGADFLDRYRKAGYAQEAGWYGPYAYDAAWSLIEAVKSLVTANGGTLPDDARAKMPRAVAGLGFDGVTGHVAFDEYGDTLNRRLTVFSVTGGRWTTVTGGG
jgi:ABC-type branched-subunit amino acid transport system substrate-binding protein